MDCGKGTFVISNLGQHWCPVTIALKLPLRSRFPLAQAFPILFVPRPSLQSVKSLDPFLESQFSICKILDRATKKPVILKYISTHGPLRGQWAPEKEIPVTLILRAFPIPSFHLALSRVPLLSLNWPTRNLPREPKAQQRNFLGPSMTSNYSLTSYSSCIWVLLTPSQTCLLNPPSPLILCTTAFNNLTTSPLDFCITLLTRCCPDSFPSVYIEKSEPSFQIQTGQVVPLSRINTKFFSCQSQHSRTWPWPSCPACLGLRGPSQRP